MVLIFSCLFHFWIIKRIHQNIRLTWSTGVIYKNGSTEKLENLELCHFSLAGQCRPFDLAQKTIATHQIIIIINRVRNLLVCYLWSKLGSLPVLFCSKYMLYWPIRLPWFLVCNPWLLVILGFLVTLRKENACSQIKFLIIFSLKILDESHNHKTRSYGDSKTEIA